MSTTINLTLPRKKYETQPSAISYQGNDVCLFPPVDSTQSGNGDFYAGNRIIGDSIQPCDFTTFGNAACSLAGGLELAKNLRVGNNVQIDQGVNVIGTDGVIVSNGPVTAKSISADSSTFNTIVTNTNITTPSITSGTENVTTLNVSGATALKGGLSVENADVLLKASTKLNMLSTDSNSISTSGGITAATDIASKTKFMVSQSAPVTASLSLGLNSPDGGTVLQSVSNTPMYLLTSSAISFQTSLNANVVPRLTLTDTNVSTSIPFLSSNTTSDAIKTLGGVNAIGTGNFGNVTVNSTTSSASYTSGSIVSKGGLGIAGNARIQGPLTVGDAISATSVNAPSVTASGNQNATSTTSGSLTTLGGLGVQQDAYIGGKITSQSTTDATALGNAAVVHNGGASIARSLYVGGPVNAQDNMIVQKNHNIGGVCSVTGAVYANSTLNATSPVSASLVTLGGLGVSKDIFASGSMMLGSDARIGGACQITNNTTVNSTTDSAMIGSGALVCAGGASIAKTLNVGGTAIIQGDVKIQGQLTAGGSATKINWKYSASNDNIILVNSGYGSMADAGYAAGRYQIANDNGSGSVVMDTPFFTGTCGASNNTATTINLGTTASNVDNAYNGMWILDGNNQARQIKSYSGSSQTATIYATVDQTSNSDFLQGKDFSIIPTTSLPYKLFNRQYMIHAFVEAQNRTIFGSTSINPATDALANIQQTESIQMGSLYADGPVYSNSLQARSGNSTDPVQVGGVTVAGGSLTGVSSINGRNTSQMAIISLPDNASTAVSLANTSTTSGVYQVTVTPLTTDGAFVSVYLAMYNSKLINKPDFISGSGGETLAVKWSVGNAIQVYHIKPKTTGNGALINYNVLVEKKS